MSKQSRRTFHPLRTKTCVLIPLFVYIYICTYTPKTIHNHVFDIIQFVSYIFLHFHLNMQCCRRELNENENILVNNVSFHSIFFFVSIVSYYMEVWILILFLRVNKQSEKNKLSQRFSFVSDKKGQIDGISSSLCFFISKSFLSLPE